jgi:hypothetical protein
MARFRAYIAVFSLKKGIILKNPWQERKTILGVLAKRRKSKDAGDSYQLQEPSASYGEHFGAKTKI